ncbi:urease accessory protein UreD [Aestuariicoccus sp. KMU-90]|uniref:Urease accessory protein UreD n=1 Tax=Thetidibacter halocola TaxID=2827239 RepID=A0A8J7WFE1_9RHOB|nr:urease accessory protein UreD [Thetidibacter halocola]
MAVKRRGDKSVIRDLAMAGSAKLLFPRGAGPMLDAVFLNSAGGVTGGDDFSLSASVDDGASLRLSTQAAERIYRAPPDSAPGRIDTRLTAGQGAALHWLPQETILFDGAALDRRLRIEMAADARVIACETLIFGRAAMGESVHDLRLSDRIDLIRDGRLVLADRLRLVGNAAAQLGRLTGGALAVASVAVAAPGVAAMLDALRAQLPATAGASALDDGLIFVRLVAEDGYVLRQSLVPLLRLLAQDDLPRPWML